MDRRRRSTRIELPLEGMGKTVRRREKPRERWLLTRKTWKYMADAGRRLIPDGAQNRIEDVPRIEAYFQEVCSKEPRFLLWRKSSYPGALPRPRRKKRARGGSVRDPSPDDPPPPVRPTDLYVGHTSGGRFDMAKLKRDFLAAPVQPRREHVSLPPRRISPPHLPPPDPFEEEENTLLEMLRKYLKVEEDEGVGHVSDADELVRSLRRFLGRQGEREAAEAARRLADPARPEPGSAQRSLLDTLGRYYSRSPNRDHIVQDLLTDRKLLKKLYHDLRKTNSYRGGRGGGGGGGYAGGAYGVGAGPSGSWRLGLRTRVVDPELEEGEGSGVREPPRSPPPLIEVQGESQEDRYVDCGTQTPPVPEEVLVEAERLYRERCEAATAPTSPTSPPPGPRRRSSVDHDDVSQSVSDTIKRYLRMARKKSVDADKADQFKRINYDKNLRNIKPRERPEFEDDAYNKGSQTIEEWMLTYRELKFASVPSPPASPPPSPASTAAHTSFLSTLLGRGAPAVAPAVSAGGMQKSRSSSSVVQSVSKRIWRTRSRSSSRVAANWTPQGSCAWADGGGRAVRLADTSLLTLSEVERRALQQAALARLQQLNLGCTIKIPEENAAVSSKPKRRAYLLKRKALTTGFFDQSRPKDDKDKDGAGSVFGVPLAQCVESERALRRQQLGSRTSLASLGALERGDDSESCDSGEWGSGSECRLQWSGLDESAAGAGGPRVPGLVSACLAHLRRHGLHTLGLFRVSSSKKRVRQLREEWERGAGAAGGGGGGREAALDAATCPHDVATLLKEFLRDLPDPLLCRDLYSAFLQTQKIRNRRLQWEALRLVIQLLPAAHRDTLNALLSFLSQLAAHADDTKHAAGNKMDAANLATVFAPNILHRSKPGDQASAEQLSERADVINVVRLLIEKQAELWTLPAELLHEAYIHLAHTAPAHLDSLLLRRAECAAERVSAPGDGDAEATPERRKWSREDCLHSGAATGGPDRDVRTRRSEKTRTRRIRETASDTSSGSLSSAMTIVTRVRSSVEECGSSGVVCSPPPSAPASAATSATGRTDSAPDSADSASDYNETVGGSDDDSCVITASLHIPAAFGRESTSPREARRSPAAPPRRRRSTSGSESSNKRDSAVGSGTTPSSPASWASSPPASPPPTATAPVRVTLTSAGEIRRRRDGSAVRPAAVTATTDIDRLLGIGRERNTSDARAVVLRQRDDATAPPTSAVTLYKRGELISSARPQP